MGPISHRDEQHGRRDTINGRTAGNVHSAVRFRTEPEHSDPGGDHLRDHDRAIIQHGPGRLHDARGMDRGGSCPMAAPGENVADRVDDGSGRPMGRGSERYHDQHPDKRYHQRSAGIGTHPDRRYQAVQDEPDSTSGARSGGSRCERIRRRRDKFP